MANKPTGFQGIAPKPIDIHNLPKKKSAAPAAPAAAPAAKPIAPPAPPAPAPTGSSVTLAPPAK